MVCYCTSSLKRAKNGIGSVGRINPAYFIPLALHGTIKAMKGGIDRDKYCIRRCSFCLFTPLHTELVKCTGMIQYITRPA